MPSGLSVTGNPWCGIPLALTIADPSFSHTVSRWYGDHRSVDAPSTNRQPTRAAADTNDQAVRPRESPSSSASRAITTSHPTGPTPTHDSRVNAAIPAIDPRMSNA